MERRSFLKVLGIEVAVGVPTITTATSKHKCEYVSCVEHYNGFHLKWTGWKQTAGCNIVAAQWLAYEVDKSFNKTKREWNRGIIMIYSSIPGTVNQFNLGDTFDLSWKHYQSKEVYDCPLPPELIAKQSWAIKEKENALILLKDYIDKKLEGVI